MKQNIFAPLKLCDTASCSFELITSDLLVKYILFRYRVYSSLRTHASVYNKIG